MKNIFILIPWFHPAYKAGGPIQSVANLISQFAGELSFKIFTSDYDLDKSILKVKTDHWVPYDATSEVIYCSKKNRTFQAIKKEGKAKSVDVLFIIGIYSWLYNILPIFFYRNTRKIISVSGMLHPGALSQKRIKKKIYLTFCKIIGIHRCCDFHASNDEERIYIQKVFGKNINIYVAPNFPRRIPYFSAFDKKSKSLRLVSIALISPMKNHLIVLQALMLCKANIEYNIYGPVKNHEYWSKCRDIIDKLPENISVNYHGDIPHSEIEKALIHNHVFILPSKSENFGHAFYEALSSGKPVITSHNTPWNSLKPSLAGINVNTGNINEITNAINFFADMDISEFQQWCIGATNYSEKAIDIHDIKNQHKRMFHIL